MSAAQSENWRELSPGTWVFGGKQAAGRVRTAAGMTPVDTAIKNCRVVGWEGTLSTGVAINNGKIVSLARDEDLPPAHRVIDARGNHVIPGLVDAHMHLLYPGSVEHTMNLQHETRASAAGGVTTIIHLIMDPGSITRACQEFVALYEQNGYVDVALTAAMFSDNQVNEMPALIDFGLPAVKLLIPYRGEESLEGMPGIDDGLAYLTFKKVADLKKQGYRIFCRVHCENIEVFLKMKHEFMARGDEPASWNEARPSLLEAEAMHRCIYLADALGCPLYVAHMTIKEGVDIIARARGEGKDVLVETCPHYLVLNTDNTDKLLSKVNPPIRTDKDNEKLWEGIRNGVISVVATDHAPCRREDKHEFWAAHVGMAGVQTWLPIMLSEGVNKGKISLEKLVEVCCYNPAQIYGLAPQKGVIEVGADADLVVVDLNKEVKVTHTDIHSFTDYSNYEDWTLKGWPVLTMVRGNMLMEDGEIVGRAGTGRYVPARVK
ncbi:MAG: amidohydrolase family protein [Dehalococcoidia bacterium]|nr:amidohydrolase family protein [Dehalococcoidia bacterium]